MATRSIIAKVGFNLTLEMLIVDRDLEDSREARRSNVSISHLRCLSLIGKIDLKSIPEPFDSFNLTLEMLIVDRQRLPGKMLRPFAGFQSHT